MQPHYNTNFAMSIPPGNFFLIGILEKNLKVGSLDGKLTARSGGCNL
jgi:hypothetical protein